MAKEISDINTVQGILSGNGGDNFEKLASFTKQGSQYSSRHSISFAQLFKGIVRGMIALALTVLIVIDSTVAGMCLVLGLGYTLSLPLIGALGGAALLAFGAAMLRQVNREAFMHKVDACLKVMGVSKAPNVQKTEAAPAKSDLLDTIRAGEVEPRSKAIVLSYYSQKDADAAQVSHVDEASLSNTEACGAKLSTQ